MFKVLFCSLQYHYGQPEAGLSFECQNLYNALKSMPGVAVTFFPIDKCNYPEGAAAQQRALLHAVEQHAPDLVFTVLFEDELWPETIAAITKQTLTINWFCDDHWRWPIFSRHWAPYFTWITTTDSQAVAKYRAIGYKNVIKTQWAANTNLYRPTVEGGGVPQVTFVGERYGKRPQYIDALQSAGVAVGAHGNNWSGGRVDFKTMIQLFSADGIHLNFSESPYFNMYRAARLFGRHLIKPDKRSAAWKKPTLHSAFSSAQGALRNQIKGRTFEIPACGGLLCTNMADNLSEYFVPEKEMVVFTTSKDLIEKCMYYLAHPLERQAIALAGYERVLRDHTYVQRMGHIFKSMGIQSL